MTDAEVLAEFETYSMTHPTTSRTDAEVKAEAALYFEKEGMTTNPLEEIGYDPFQGFESEKDKLEFNYTAQTALNSTVNFDDYDTSTPEKYDALMEGLAVQRIKTLLESKDGRTYDDPMELKRRYMRDTNRATPQGAIDYYNSVYQSTDIEMNDDIQMKNDDPLYKHVWYGASESIRGGIRGFYRNALEHAKLGRAVDLKNIEEGGPELKFVMDFQDDVIKALQEVVGGMEIEDFLIESGQFQDRTMLDKIMLEESPEGSKLRHQVAQAAGGVLIDAPITAAAPIAGMAHSYNRMYDEGYQQTGDHDIAVQYGIIGGSLDFISNMIMAAPASKIAKSAIPLKVLGKLGLNVGSESTTEGLQYLLLQKLSGEEVDSKELLNNMVVGGIVGGGSFVAVETVDKVVNSIKQDITFMGQKETIDGKLDELIILEIPVEDVNNVKLSDGSNIEVVFEEDGAINIKEDGESKIDEIHDTKDTTSIRIGDDIIVVNKTDGEVTITTRNGDRLITKTDGIVKNDTELSIDKIANQAKIVKEKLKGAKTVQEVNDILANEGAVLDTAVAEMKENQPHLLSPIGGLFNNPLTDNEWDVINENFDEMDLKEGLAGIDPKIAKTLLDAIKGDPKARQKYNDQLRTANLHEKIANSEPLNEQDIALLERTTKVQIKDKRPNSPELMEAYTELNKRVAESKTMTLANMLSHQTRLKLYPKLSGRIRQYESGIARFYHNQVRTIDQQFTSFSTLERAAEVGIGTAEMTHPVTGKKTTVSEYLQVEMDNAKLAMLTGRFEDAFNIVDKISKQVEAIEFSKQLSDKFGEIFNEDGSIDPKAARQALIDFQKSVEGKSEAEIKETVDDIKKSSDEKVIKTVEDVIGAVSGEKLTAQNIRQMKRLKDAVNDIFYMTGSDGKLSDVKSTPKEISARLKEILKEGSIILGRDQIMNYFPLNVKDVDAYRKYIRENGIEMTDGRKTREEDIMDSILGKGTPQKRSVAKLTVDQLQFYASPEKAFKNYLLAMARSKSADRLLYDSAEKDVAYIEDVTERIAETQKALDDVRIEIKSLEKRKVDYKNKTNDLKTAEDNLNTVNDFAKTNNEIGRGKVKKAKAQLKKHQKQLTKLRPTQKAKIRDLNGMIRRDEARVQTAEKNLDKVKTKGKEKVKTARKGLREVKTKYKLSPEGINDKILTLKDSENKKVEVVADLTTKSHKAKRRADERGVIKYNEKGEFESLEFNPETLIEALKDDVDLESLGKKEEAKLIADLKAVFNYSKTHEAVKIYKRVVAVESVSGWTTMAKQFQDQAITFGDVLAINRNLTDTWGDIFKTSMDDVMGGWTAINKGSEISVEIKEFLEWIGAELTDQDIKAIEGMDSNIIKEYRRVRQEFHNTKSYKKSMAQIMSEVAESSSDATTKAEMIELRTKFLAGEMLGEKLKARLEYTEALLMTGLKVTDRYNRMLTLKSRVGQLQRLIGENQSKAYGEILNIVKDQELASKAMEDIKNKKLTDASSLVLYTILADKHPLAPSETSQWSKAGNVGKIVTTFKSFAFRNSARFADMVVTPSKTAHESRRLMTETYRDAKRSRKLAEDATNDVERQDHTDNAVKLEKQSEFYRSEFKRNKVMGWKGFGIFTGFTLIPDTLMAMAIAKGLEGIGWVIEEMFGIEAPEKREVSFDEYLINNAVSSLNPMLNPYNLREGIQKQNPAIFLDGIMDVPIPGIITPVANELFGMFDEDDDVSASEYYNALPSTFRPAGNF